MPAVFTHKLAGQFSHFTCVCVLPVSHRDSDLVEIKVVICATVLSSLCKRCARPTGFQFSAPQMRKCVHVPPCLLFRRHMCLKCALLSSQNLRVYTTYIFIGTTKEIAYSQKSRHKFALPCCIAIARERKQRESFPSCVSQARTVTRSPRVKSMQAPEIPHASCPAASRPYT
jgi:hypothetical protein